MVAKSEETCYGCTVQNGFKQVLSIPMVVDGEVKGIITVYLTTDRVKEGEMELLKTMANDLAFAIKTLELDEVKKRAYEQIEKNIEQFAVLIDHIRNPLATLQAIAETKMDVDVADMTIEQIKRIVDVIKKLDEGWIESEKIKEFLKKYR
ncbi:hypothetical protein DRP05_05365 [Archaeoglobales archaeon]|nr:MAG: hypothetical protein DRP05_05365 [Archaeoglobales archaeon]